MTAEVIISPSVPSPSAAVLARKRRREKMRGTPTSVTTVTSHFTAKDLQTKGILPPKKRRVSVDSSDTSSTESSPVRKVNVVVDENLVKRESKSAVKSTSGKKQMRYDPDVPMTKEEASAWRREARRVRNRESAAASRRKIRDRIEVLEGEVDEWKSKYEAIMMKLQDAKARNGSAIVSPLHRPQESPVPVTSMSADPSNITRLSEGSSQQHLIETILRPAAS